jgi:PAS domain S-box-containing protein
MGVMSKSSAGADLEDFMGSGKSVAGTFVMQKGHLQNVSESVAELLGYANAQAVTDKSFWGLIHPADRHRVRIGRRKHGKAVSAGSNFLRVLRKDGSPVWVDIQGGIVHLEGRPAFVGCMLAIATMQEPEGQRPVDEPAAHLAAVGQSLQDAIITVSPQMIVIEANASAETLCGIEAKQMVGRLFTQGPHPCGAGCVRVLQETLAQQQPMQEYRVTCNLQKRPSRVVSASGTPLRDDLGNLLGAMLILRDMTRLRDLQRELHQRNEYQGLIGQSKSMQDIYRLVDDLADLDDAVLISGERGTGKKLIARALHDSGRRAFDQFVSVKCSGSDDNSLDHELFGYLKGAFAGANRDQPGQFERAEGGTIFLDEIVELSPKMQLKLSRVLQEKEFERIGDTVPRQLKARVVASTSRDLRQKIKNGEFREDFYYCLKGAEIVPPPLRQRPEDILLLAEHFRKRCNLKFGEKVETITGDALALFMDYHWPGNVREFEQVMEHAFVICEGERIGAAHLPAEINKPNMPKPNNPPADETEPDKGSHEILKALNRTFWNKSKAAQLLGISRQTLYRKLHEYGLL